MNETEYRQRELSSLEHGGEPCAVFRGYLSECVSPNAEDHRSLGYQFVAELISGGGRIVYSRVISSEEYDVEIPASLVSYADFGAELPVTGELGAGGVRESIPSASARCGWPRHTPRTLSRAATPLTGTSGD